jgi:hypothetical protein
MLARFLLVLFFVNANLCLAQNCLDDILHSRLYSKSEDIINGRKWINEKHYSGSPLLMDKYWPTADVSYNGLHYSGEIVNYDLSKDEMIIYRSEGSIIKFVVISNEKLTGFAFTDTITGEKYFYEYKELPGIEGKALYEMTASGRIILYIKPVKKVQLRTVSEGMGEFNDFFEYYLNDGDGFARVTSNRQFLKLFPEHEAEVKKYIRNHSIKIDEKHPGNIIDLVHYCNLLN